MKKIFTSVLAAVIMCSNVFAGDISVILDGKSVVFDRQEPVISEGRTLIPLRGVFEKLGYEIDWDGETKTVVLNGSSTIAVPVGSQYIYVNGEAVEIDVPASIINGSAMLPLRAVGEAAGIKVLYDGELKTVFLYSPDYEAPEEPAGEDISEEELQTIRESLKQYAAVQYMQNMFISFTNYADYVMDIAAEDVNGERGEEFFAAVDVMYEYSEFSYSYDRSMFDNDLCNAFADYVVRYAFYANLLGDFWYTDKYADAAEDELDKVMAQFGEEISAKEEAFYAASEACMNKFEIGRSNARYNFAASLSEGDELPPEAADYLSWAGERAEILFSFLSEEDAVINNADDCIYAAAELSMELKPADTPTNCIFEKEALMLACEYLACAANAIRYDEAEGEISAMAYIDCYNAFYAFDTLMRSALGSYFTAPYGSYYYTE